MEALSIRPRLVSFRTTSFHGDNQDASDAKAKWTIQFTQTVNVGLTAVGKESKVMQAVVQIELLAKAGKEGAPEQQASFQGNYEAKFLYAPEVQEQDVVALFEQEPHQYLLVAQAVPLAMMYFKREMQAMGFDARELPLGI
ncbi:MAG: hypothetical protein ACOY95_13345 [Pseudomonadota bacterium]